MKGFLRYGRWLVALGTVAACVAGLAGQEVQAPAAAPAPVTTLPATNLDLNAARVFQLEQEMAKLTATVTGLKADTAVCQANLEQAKRETTSLLLTNEVDRAIKELQRVYPGSQWYWDNNTRRITPAVKEKDKP